MWPFEPRGRRQVYEGGGDAGGDGGDGNGGGDGDGDGGFDSGSGYDTGTEGAAGHGGTPGGAPTGGGTVEAGGMGPGTEGGVTGGGGPAAGGGGGHPGGEGTAEAGVGGGGLGPEGTGTAPQDGGTPTDGGFGSGIPGGTALGAAATAAGPYSENPAASGPYSGAVSTGMMDTSYSPSFGSIVDQFGPLADPFATAPSLTSDDDQRGPLSDENVVVGDQFAQARGAPPGGLTGALAARALEDPGGLWAGSVPAPAGTQLGLSGHMGPAPTSGPAPDDTPMTGLTPELAASLAGPTPAPDTPTAPTGAPGTPADSTPGQQQPDAAPGYTAADAAASAPSTEQFSPTPNIGTAIMQAIFGLGGAAIGGPISGFLNQNLASTVGPLNVPGVSAAASLLGNAQTIGGFTGVTPSQAGSPMERAQPNIASMLWDELNGRPSRSRGISPIGGMMRPSIASYLLSRDNRTPVGENPPPDPRTYDIGQLLAAGQPPRGVAQLLTPREQLEAKMVPQDFDLTGGNQAGDNRVVDMMLVALGLEPTTGPTPGQQPTPGQLPFDAPAYFAGGQSDLNPVIEGQRTAFDPRRFVA